MRLQKHPQKGLLGTALSRNIEKDSTSTAEKESFGEPTGVSHPVGPLPIWTTGVWERESMIMRWLEHGLVKSVQRWTTPPAGEAIDPTPFLKVLRKPEPQRKLSVLEHLFARLRGG
jgi:phosphatidylglycerophosphatase GEP4